MQRTLLSAEMARGTLCNSESARLSSFTIDDAASLAPVRNEFDLPINQKCRRATR